MVPCCMSRTSHLSAAHKLENQAIKMVAIGLVAGFPNAFAGRSVWSQVTHVGYGVTGR